MIKAICDCLIIIFNGVGFCKVIGEEVEYGSIFSAPVDGMEVGYKMVSLDFIGDTSAGAE